MSLRAPSSVLSCGGVPWWSQGTQLTVTNGVPASTSAAPAGALAERVAAVAVADGRRLGGDVEGGGHGLAGEHVEGALVIGVEVAEPRVGVAAELVHRLEDAAAILQPAERDAPWAASGS